MAFGRDLDSGRELNTGRPAGGLGIGGSDADGLGVGQRRGLARFPADAPLCCCTVAPDGKTILAGDEGGVIHYLRSRTAGKTNR